MIKKCFEEAKEVLKRNETKIGIKAGDLYPDFWFRDSLISSIGMSYSKDEELLRVSKKIINSISNFQKYNGQIPNKVSQDGKKVCFGESGCIDTSLWYPIALLNYYRNTDDKNFLKKKMKNVKKVISWILCLDINNDFLIETTEGEDWNDWLIRSGRVLYDNVLLFKALKSYEEITEHLKIKNNYAGMEEKVKDHINLLLWPKKENLKLVRKNFGFSYISKDFEIALKGGERPYYFAEIGFRKYDPRCDVYANTLSILFGIPDEGKIKKTLDYFKNKEVYEPYPIRILDPPIYENDLFRAFYFRKSDFPYTQKPGFGQNGGIWPFAGGFYVLMLKKIGFKFDDILRKLAEANIHTQFNEWLDWNGNAYGSKNQSWNAATYILAYLGKEVKL